MKKKRSNFNSRLAFHNCLQISRPICVVTCGYRSKLQLLIHNLVGRQATFCILTLLVTLTRHMCVQQRSSLSVRLLKDLFLRANIELPSNYQTPCLPSPWCRGAWNDGYILFLEGHYIAITIQLSQSDYLNLSLKVCIISRMQIRQNSNPNAIARLYIILNNFNFVPSSLQLVNQKPALGIKSASNAMVDTAK